jgi:rhodanese-related sulfurtransferase
MRTGAQAAIIAVVALLGSLIVWRIAGPPQRLAADEVELATVLNDWQGKVLWIDARKRADWQRDGLTGSVLVTLDPAEDFDTLVAEALPKFAAIDRAVVYCGDPGCGSSREVAKRLRDYAVGPKFFALRGGWQAIEQAGMAKAK